MPHRRRKLDDKVSPKAIGRLISYRRVVGELERAGSDQVFSHEIADLSGATAAQVRRDIMAIGYSGVPKRGYQVVSLRRGLDAFLKATTEGKAVLVGMGNLGRALLAYFSGSRHGFSIEAAFESDAAKVGKSIGGCRCYSMKRMGEMVKRLGVTVGIVAVPESAAQDVAQLLVDAGITGILNFAPIALSVPERVFVEDLDVGMSLQKIAFFASRGS